MMHDDVFQQLKASPDAVLIINQFQDYLKTEAQKRQEFYDLVHENIKAEFINGEIVLHSPVARKHWLISSRVSFQLMSYVNQHQLGEIGIEKVMIELSRNNYEPDIVYFRREISEKFTADQKLFPAPDLVVEILSDSTRKNDYGIKFRDYAAHQVGEYWIIDPQTNTIEQYVLLNGIFELQNKLTQKGVLTSLIVPGFLLDLATVFE
ncbi:MAG: Uma2 family endonuclease [Microscillaceae bacterium]|jgi:Uma2 family endonuclease|nr:Uma2 family endonuclease [Microscillaceae bacterium]